PTCPTQRTEIIIVYFLASMKHSLTLSSNFHYPIPKSNILRLKCGTLLTNALQPLVLLRLRIVYYLSNSIVLGVRNITARLANRAHHL
ncbi:hypothetical protein EW026_g6956, partial [Hermanssonia centrifuga]